MAGKPKVSDDHRNGIAEGYEKGLAEARTQIDEAKQQAVNSNLFGVMAGRVQAFKAVGLIAEFLAWKQISQMIENKEHLNIQGVNSIEDYFEQMGIKPSTAYNNLKIARKLEVDELQTLERIGFTRKDLLGYASLPDEARMEIRDGKIINLEKADREEIRELIEQIVTENRQIKTEMGKSKVATDRLLEDKQKRIQLLEHKNDALEKEAFESTDEAAFIKYLDQKKLVFEEIYMRSLEESAESLRKMASASPTGRVPARMEAALLATVFFMRSRIFGLYGLIEDEFTNFKTNPDALADFKKWKNSTEEIDPKYLNSPKG
jgi:hypothetical protein